MKQVMLSGLSWTAGVTAVMMAVLKMGGDFPTLQSFLSPRLLTAAGVTWIVFTGLFSLFKKSFLKKYALWALGIPLLWTVVFTFAYAFAGLPEKKHLGDYYMVSALAFSLPYISMAWTARIKRGRTLWMVIQGTAAGLMVIIPLIYLGYYFLFGGEMDMFAMMAVLSTHVTEVEAFIQTVGSPVMAAGAGLLTAAVFSACILGVRRVMQSAAGEVLIFRGNSMRFRILLVFLSVLFTGGFIRMMLHVFPYSIYKSLNSRGSEFQMLQQLDQNLDRNVKNMHLLIPDNGGEGTHIVVIGESADRDHMKAFTGDYPYQTTPWLSSMAGTPDFAMGYKAYSSFPNTLMSLSYALTSANQYGDMSLEHVVSLVDAVRAAGYETDWISFKNRSSLSTAAVTMIAERSDHSYWEQNPDGYALEVIKKLPPSKKRVIFINIAGSHYTYLSRVPLAERDRLGISSEDPYYDYDLTIAYTDQVLKDIFNYARENMNLQSMTYFSDHGENMKHYHTASPFFFDMVHIPFFVYLSPDYQLSHPGLMETLKSHEHRVFTNDLVFDTLSGILGAQTNFYQASYDFSSPVYAVTADQAMTLAGKRHISEDPDFSK